MAKYICPACTLETDQEICPDCGEKNEHVALPEEKTEDQKDEKYSEDELKEADVIDEESEIAEDIE
ncbi:MAG: hypothetical protein UR93_C0023G0005 [Berkelbacteria bacterium GW2011_GWA2_35_9]|uniref:Uncharacterized protein n=1 Tax=Berkelbacteria bacterium GW2011_GWA2_35_9 TaxID=1618333 RepID=A0A0G0DH01_9BACT|nr:MAG: hypothetical protein UR93_C0023G0005 [Berkelbacteria bacterium GW2011_GWA2_35_9]